MCQHCDDHADRASKSMSPQDLAKRGAVVHMVCRNPERGQQAVQDVIASTGNMDVHLQVSARCGACSPDQLADHVTLFHCSVTRNTCDTCSADL